MNHNQDTGWQAEEHSGIRVPIVYLAKTSPEESENSEEEKTAKLSKSDNYDFSN